MPEKGIVPSCASDSIAAITTKPLQLTRLKGSRERTSTSLGRGTAPPFIARGRWSPWAPPSSKAHTLKMKICGNIAALLFTLKCSLALTKVASQVHSFLAQVLPHPLSHVFRTRSHLFVCTLVCRALTGFNAAKAWAQRHHLSFMHYDIDQARRNWLANSMSSTP